MSLPGSCAKANWRAAPGRRLTRRSANARIAERCALADSRNRWCFKGFAEKSVTISQVTFADVVVGLFFPPAACLGLSARSTVAPTILRKMVWAGSNLSGYAMAEHEAAVEQFREMDLPKQQVGSTAVEPPQVGVITMDGGRCQRRDHFGDKDRPANQNHWREDKAGCLLSMRGGTHESDSALLDSFWLRHQARQTGTNVYAQTT